MGVRRVIVFHLKRYWPGPQGKINLYKEIKEGRKTSEWREATEFWRRRLLGENPPSHAWFVTGYPKANLPRLEAEILEIIEHKDLGQIETKFANAHEVLPV